MVLSISLLIIFYNNIMIDNSYKWSSIVSLKIALNCSLTSIYEPIINFYHRNFAFSRHHLFFLSCGIGILEVHQQPFHHCSCCITRNFEIFTLCFTFSFRFLALLLIFHFLVFLDFGLAMGNSFFYFSFALWFWL